jgi:hypothetical protein
MPEPNLAALLRVITDIGRNPATQHAREFA